MKAIILGLQGRRAEAIREVGRVLKAVPSHEKALFATLMGLHPDLKEPLTRWFADERRAAP